MPGGGAGHAACITDAFLNRNLSPLVYGGAVEPVWDADNDTFWYRRTKREGKEFLPPEGYVISGG